MGLIGGNFPYNSPEIFSSDVVSLKGQASVNLTATYKVELLNFAKFEFEFELVPILASLGTDMYSTSMLGDNCFWTYYNYHSFNFNTRFSSRVLSYKIPI